MTSRVYSTWNPNAVGDGLVLTQGNLVVTTEFGSLDNSRKVLATLPKASSSGYFQTKFWSTARSDLGTQVAVGLAKPTSALDAAPGADADSIGYYPATGEIVLNGSTLTSVPPIDERVAINLYYFVGGGHSFVSFMTNGSFLYSADLGATDFWMPTLVVSGGDNAGDVSAIANFGQSGFDYTFTSAP